MKNKTQSFSDNEGYFMDSKILNIVGKFKKNTDYEIEIDLLNFSILEYEINIQT